MLVGSRWIRWSGWVGESVERTKPSMALVREVPDGPCIWSWVWRYVVPGHARVLWPSTSRKLMFNNVFSFFVHDSLLGAARAWSLKFFRQLAQHVAPQVCSLLSPWFWALVFFFVGWSSVFWLPLSIWRACKQIQQRILRFHFQRFFSCEALIKVVAAKVFVETHKSDLGGHFWRVQMQHTQLGLVIYIVVSNLLPSLPCWRIVGLEFGVSFFLLQAVLSMKVRRWWPWSSLIEKSRDCYDLRSAEVCPLISRQPWSNQVGKCCSSVSSYTIWYNMILHAGRKHTCPQMWKADSISTAEAGTLSSIGHFALLQQVSPSKVSWRVHR